MYGHISTSRENNMCLFMITIIGYRKMDHVLYIYLNWHCGNSYSETYYCCTQITYVIFAPMRSLFLVFVVIPESHLKRRLSGLLCMIGWNVCLPLCQCISIVPSHKSHDASDKYTTMHHFVTELCMCAHFCYKKVHYGIWDQCIMGFVRLVYSQSSTTLLWNIMIIQFGA